MQYGKNWKGNILLLALGVFLAVRIGFNLVKLYKAGNRISQAEEVWEETKEENTRLRERLAEVQTPEYMEREAREKLGMGKEGEVVVIIPDEELQAINRQEQIAVVGDPNWIRWRKLYLGW